jgi:hypothetical protein
VTLTFGKKEAVHLRPFVRRRTQNIFESLFTTKPRRWIMSKTYRISTPYRYNYIHLTVQLMLYKIYVVDISGYGWRNLVFISRLLRARIRIWRSAITCRTRHVVYNFFVVIRAVCKCTISITIISSSASTLSSTYVYNIWPVVFTATILNTQTCATFKD